MVLPFLAAAVFLLPGRALAAPADYFVDSVEVLAPRVLSREEKTGEYTCLIRRDAPDSLSARLLGIAEAVYPDRDLLIEIAVRKGYEIGPDSAGVPLWWCNGTRERRVPFAVTAGAVHHYWKITERYQNREAREPGTQSIFRSRLTYEARISTREDFALRGASFRNVYVASLALSWTYDDGTFLPLITARRVVVLAPDGRVLAVDGDGTAVEEVTFSSNRGIGRQKDLHR